MPGNYDTESTCVYILRLGKKMVDAFNFPNLLLFIAVFVEIPGPVAGLVLDWPDSSSLLAAAALLAVPAPPDAAELLPNDEVLAPRLYLLFSVKLAEHSAAYV